MKRYHNKKVRYIIISAIALFAFTATVAYALLSKTLTIGGNVNQKGGTWNIYLADPTVYQVTGAAKSEKAEITNNNTTLNIMPSLTQPGDSITYTFKVKNGGTVNARFLGWELVNASEFNSLANKYKITTTLTYLDGTSLQSYSDILNAKTEKTLKLTFKYTGTSPITDDDVFIPIELRLEYSQVNLATS